MRLSHSCTGVVRIISEMLSTISTPERSLAVMFRSVMTGEAPRALKLSTEAWDPIQLKTLSAEKSDNTTRSNVLEIQKISTSYQAGRLFREALLLLIPGFDFRAWPPSNQYVRRKAMRSILKVAANPGTYSGPVFLTDNFSN